MDGKCDADIGCCCDVPVDRFLDLREKNLTAGILERGKGMIMSYEVLETNCVCGD